MKVYGACTFTTYANVHGAQACKHVSLGLSARTRQGRIPYADDPIYSTELIKYSMKSRGKAVVGVLLLAASTSTSIFGYKALLSTRQVVLQAARLPLKLLYGSSEAALVGTLVHALNELLSYSKVVYGTVMHCHVSMFS